jgi:chloride channel protein, CIC family
MYWTEHRFSELKMPKPLRPAIGGAMLGVAGVIYIIVFGQLLLHAPNNKPFAHASYPMPAFFGDGYGIIQQMLTSDFYVVMGPKIILLLVFLCLAKIVGTCVTLGSGGSGGVIAPSVFIGATLGAVLGELLRRTGWFWQLQPEMYALVGMGALLAAVVHAPLASILICFELTQDYKVMLPAMLACIMAVAVARVVYPYSVYTLGLRTRGVRVGSAGDFVLLRRIMVEQIALDPVSIVHGSEPLQRLLELSALTSTYDFVVCDQKGIYEGMVVAADMNPVLMDQAAVPLLVVGDLMRSDITPVKTTDDLAAVFDAFSRHDVNHLPVCMAPSCEKIIGLISRSAVIRKYQEALKQV